MRSFVWITGFFLVFVATATVTAADDAHHSLWVVKGNSNSVVLLGSVHMLKPDASELPAVALRAYEHAAAVVMELDLGSVGTEDMALAMSTLGTLPEEQTLAGVLGPALYSRFRTQAASEGLDAELLEHMQPWMAALLLDQAQMARLGFAGAAGVDQQLAQRAAADHKRIVGLETIDEQLGMFAQLSTEQQRHFMRYTLDEQGHAAEQLGTVVTAWRGGDTRALEKLLGEGFADFPDLYRLLTTDRNRKWMATVVPLLSGTQDYLVVVGALHLVGKDGLVALLRDRGYTVVQH
jgi:uncharacterized protein YbaP (TraB family)